MTLLLLGAPDLAQDPLLRESSLVADKLFLKGGLVGKARDHDPHALPVIDVALLLIHVHCHLADGAQCLAQWCFVSMVDIGVLEEIVEQHAVTRNTLHWLDQKRSQVQASRC